MTDSNIDDRLKRLAESGVCSCQNNVESVGELKNLAEQTMGNDSVSVIKKAKFFKALSDTTRLRILGLLTLREMCVCEVMVALDLTQPTASHHLRILENVGLVKDRKEGKWVFYSIAKPEVLEGMRKLAIL